MSSIDPAIKSEFLSSDQGPVTLPLSVSQFSELVNHGHFEGQRGQIELINGRITQMNPQGPQHSDSLDRLSEWCIEQAARRFRIRIEKPIELVAASSVPEPDIAWVKRKSYDQYHPQHDDVFLVIEASVSSVCFDTGEKCELYARCEIPEYWQINVPRREIRVHRDPSDGVYRTITTHTISETISPTCLPEACLPIQLLFPQQLPANGAAP